MPFDEATFDDPKVGWRKISRYLENLMRPHVFKGDLDSCCQATAADQEREREAKNRRKTRRWVKRSAPIELSMMGALTLHPSYNRIR